ncbi:hypothetical protein NEF87_003858 [Candidatus Lokiarchaeum ossiferum]|uniref:N-acetylneuraminate epimerase n=1 Tax=Candidatus Lokiarchaeum ossiferum TaxID=2951803 RepID=A0ABY6HVM2_9ARCH|nr:hypothetical protein NEF87_003858 [Candidatus Lokiarchaeum sp. B-35]
MNIIKKKTLVYGVTFILLANIFYSSGSLNPLASADSNSESKISPSARYGHRMVFIPNKSEVFMFGGEVAYQSSTLLNQSWKYSTISNNWKYIVSDKSPCARMSHGMVYIVRSNSILLFGGMNVIDVSRMNDMWEFNLETEKWEELVLAVSPSPRSDMSMYYDDSLNKVFLFGGYSPYGSKLSDMWEFDIRNQTWSEVNCSLKPRARYGHQMVYNSHSHEGILFGGNNAGMMNDLWAFNGSTLTWSELINTNPPPVRYWNCLTYMPSSNSILVYGGRNDNFDGDSLSDSWKYSFVTKSWSELLLNTNPSQRMFSFMVTDPNTSNVYLYGGVKNYNEESLDDFWVFLAQTNQWNEITSNVVYWIIGGTIFLGCGIFVCYFLWRKKQQLKK